MKQKAFFFDIDGTLLSEFSGEIPDSAKESIRLLKEKGHLAFVNTGRTICSLPSEIKAMPFAGFLCGCGTYISYGYEVLFSVHLEEDREKEIIQLFQDCDAGPAFEGLEDCYFPKNQSRFSDLEYTRHALKQQGLGQETFVEDGGFHFDKFVFWADDKSDMTTLRNNLEQDMTVIDRGGGFYEVLPKTCSKATAISFILDYFHISKDDAYVFGDSSNDLSMFEAVGHSIAMEKHDPILDPYTEYVTTAVEKDGIYNALRHYHII